MPCFSTPRPNQTLAQRTEEVRDTVSAIDKLIASRNVGIKVGPQGAAVLTGLTAAQRNDLTDVCIVRLLMNKGSAATKLAIQRAEQLAGRAISKKALQAGIHSHDGGASWHPRG